MLESLAVAKMTFRWNYLIISEIVSALQYHRICMPLISIRLLVTDEATTWYSSNDGEEMRNVFSSRMLSSHATCDYISWGSTDEAMHAHASIVIYNLDLEWHSEIVKHFMMSRPVWILAHYDRPDADCSPRRKVKWRWLRGYRWYDGAMNWRQCMIK